jgi:isopenicillin N synthase-like dioxygenase
MASVLNKAAYDRAVAIIKKGLEIEHDMRNWHEVKPTPDEIARFLDTHTLEEYGSWFLGINTDADPKDKSKYEYPFGDLQVLHKSALVSAEKIATIKYHEDVKRAAHELLEMLKQTKK